MSTGMAQWKHPCQRKQVLNDYGTSLSRKPKLSTGTRDRCSRDCRDQTGKCVLLGSPRRPSEALFHVFIHSIVICWLSALCRVQRETQAWLNQRAHIACLCDCLRFPEAFPLVVCLNQRVLHAGKSNYFKIFSKITRNRGWGNGSVGELFFLSVWIRIPRTHVKYQVKGHMLIVPVMGRGDTWIPGLTGQVS